MEEHTYFRKIYRLDGQKCGFQYSRFIWLILLNSGKFLESLANSSKFCRDETDWLEQRVYFVCIVLWAAQVNSFQWTPWAGGIQNGPVRSKSSKSALSHLSCRNKNATLGIISFVLLGSKRYSISIIFN